MLSEDVWFDAIGNALLAWTEPGGGLSYAKVRRDILAEAWSKEFMTISPLVFQGRWWNFGQSSGRLRRSKWRVGEFRICDEGIVGL